jgi:O-antigen/teichoic acid export membrane protein
MPPIGIKLSASSEEKQYEAHVGRLTRGAGISFLGQGLSKVLNYGTQVVLARFYGPAQLGLYVLGFSFVQVASILAQLGMDNGVVRYVAHYQATRDDSRVRGTILLACGLTLVLSVVLSGLMFFGAGFMAEALGQPSSKAVFRAFSVSIPFFAVMSIALWATQGFQTVKYVTYVRDILQPLINLVLIVAFYLVGAQILGAITAYILSMAAGAALALYYLKRIFPKLLDKGTPPRVETRALLGVSGPMMVSELARYMNFWAPVTVLGIFSSADAVGIYNAASRTAVLCGLVFLPFVGIFSPMVANLYQRGQLDDLRYLYKSVCRWVTTGSLAVVLLTVLLAKDIMAIFGEEFIAGWVVVAIIAGAQLFDNSAGPADRLLAMTGHQRIVMVSTLAYAGIGIGASFALVPLYSIVGAALAVAAATILLNAIILFFVWRRLRIWPYDPQYLKPLVAGFLAVTVALAIKLVLALPVGIPAILVLTVPFLVSFVVALLALGLSPSDRQLLEACWKTVRQTVWRRP